MTVRVNKSSFNIREKLSELGRKFGLKGSELAAAETVQEARDLVSAGRKNILINGNFIVSQRGDYTSATTFSSSTYYLDRWKIKGGTPTGTVQDLTRKVKLAATATNSSGQMMVMQVIEDKTINLYGGKIVTLSALVKSNNSNCRVMYEFGGGGGWMSANIDTNHNTHSGNGSEERLYVTFKIPDNYASVNSSNELRVYVGFDSYDSAGGVQINNGDYFEASEVQLEVGRNPTDFEHRPYGEELSLCQRYYQKMYFTTSDYPFGFCYTYQQGSSACSIPLAAPMRTSSPNITFATLRIRGYNQDGTNGSQNISNITGQTQESHALLQADLSHSNVPSDAVGSASVLTNGVSSSASYLAVDAEL